MESNRFHLLRSEDQRAKSSDVFVDQTAPPISCAWQLKLPPIACPTVLAERTGPETSKFSASALTTLIELSL